MKVGRGSKGFGFMGSEYAKTFKWTFYSNAKNMSYEQFYSICDACISLGIGLPDSIKYLYEQRYFFDKIVNIERVGLSNMVDIEVAQLHEFNCVGFSVHNCQGSTYKHVFIMEDDIDTNQNVYERNRIKYTAFSRPSKKLYIVRK